MTVDVYANAFGFHAFRGPSWSSDIAVDDVSIACVAPGTLLYAVSKQRGTFSVELQQ